MLHDTALAYLVAQGIFFDKHQFSESLKKSIVHLPEGNQASIVVCIFIFL